MLWGPRSDKVHLSQDCRTLANSNPEKLKVFPFCKICLKKQSETFRRMNDVPADGSDYSERD